MVGSREVNAGQRRLFPGRDDLTDFQSIADLVRGHAAVKPDTPAITVEGESLTWAELVLRAGRVAATLQRESVPVGGTIAIISYVNVDYVALYLGALMAGVAVAPMPPSATPEQLQAMVGDSAADAGAAIAAGAPLVLVAYGYRRDFDLHGCGALAVIERFDDLLALR